MRAFYAGVNRIMQLVFVALFCLTVWAIWHNAGGSPAQAGEAIGSVVRSVFSLLEQAFAWISLTLGALL